MFQSCRYIHTFNNKVNHKPERILTRFSNILYNTEYNGRKAVEKSHPEYHRMNLELKKKTAPDLFNSATKNRENRY